MEFSLNARNPTRLGNRDAVHAPQGVYRCLGADAWLTLSVTSDAEWKGLCQVLDRPELVEDARFATLEGRHANHDALDSLIGDWAATQEHNAAAAHLQSCGVPAGPVLTGKELLLDPHLKARGFFQRFTHPEESGIGTRIYHGLPFQLSEAPFSIRQPGPGLGEHNAYVLGGLLGMPDAEIQELFDEGVIGNAPRAGSSRNRTPGQTPLDTLKDKGLIEDYDPDYRAILGLP
jgi:crotonobetainyl-CoA:carnitine CoA-transferase CaiB-like acyl-CoA transferase